MFCVVTSIKMILKFALIAFFITVKVQSNAINTYNVITVPPNCPPGQEWINGQCREIWFIIKQYWKSIDGQNDVLRLDDPKPMSEYDPLIEIFPFNAVTEPSNCPVGRKYIDGQCRDIWIRRSELHKMYAQLMMNIDREKRQTEDEQASIAEERNVITVPNQCPIGYKPDALGYCRKVSN
ncbi:hypothetical protein ACJJTC_004389 [Scirpophaga incertulas]